MYTDVKDMVFMDVVSFAVSSQGTNENIIPFKRDGNGYLQGQAIIAAVGVQNYRMKDGKTLRVLRHPDDVFDSESMATLGMLPLVIRHPKKNFDPATLQGKQVGSTGERIINDAYYLYAPITVTTAKAQKVIESGEMKELSVGYKAGLLMESGTWQNQEYDARQVNIRGNHLAIVKRARAGKAASFVLADGSDQEINAEECDLMLMDDIDTSLSFADETTEPNQQTGGVVLMKYQLKNGQVVEADQAFIDSYTALLDQNVTLENDKTALEASVSDYKGKLAAAETQLQDSADAQPSHEDVIAAANSLIAVRKTATDAGVDFKDEDDEQAIKVAVIKAVMPKADFKDDSESDVSSFFSASLEVLESRKDKTVSNRKKMTGVQLQDGADVSTDKNKKVTAASLEQSFHDGLHDAYANVGEE
jgi:hypothetical protein